MNPPILDPNGGFHFASAYARGKEQGGGAHIVTSGIEEKVFEVIVPPHLYDRTIWVSLSTTNAYSPYGFLRFSLNGTVIQDNYFKTTHIAGEDIQIDWCGARTAGANQDFRSGADTFLLSTTTHTLSAVAPHKLGIFCNKIEFFFQGFVEQVDGTLDQLLGHLMCRSQYNAGQLAGMQMAAMASPEMLERLRAIESAVKELSPVLKK